MKINKLAFFGPLAIIPKILGPVSLCMSVGVITDSLGLPFFVGIIATVIFMIARSINIPTIAALLFMTFSEKTYSSV